MRLMWDADLDVDAFYKEFFDKMFGPVAKEMYDIFKLCTKRYETVQWTKKLGHSAIDDNSTFTKIYTKKIADKIKKDFMAIRKKIKKEKNPIYAKRVEFVYNENGKDGFHAFFEAMDNYHKAIVNTPFEAEKINDANIKLDGKDDEAFWEKAKLYNLFEGNNPLAMHLPRQWWKNQCRFVYSDKGLYMLFSASGEGKIIARAKVPQDILEDDQISLIIKGMNDKSKNPDTADMKEVVADIFLEKARGNYAFSVNAAGISDSEKIKCEVSRKGAKWTVEMFIPWQVLGKQKPANLMLDVRRGVALRPSLSNPPIRFMYASGRERFVELKLK